MTRQRTLSVLIVAHTVLMVSSARADGDDHAGHSNDEGGPPGASLKSDEHPSGESPAGTSDAASGAREAYADHLFQEGFLLMNNDNCPQAVLKFQASEQLDPSAATMMNLASCFARLGRTASAWRTYREAATLAAKESRGDLRDEAFKAMSKLAPTLTKLKVVPPRDSTAMTLTLNGEPLGADNGLPIALDPGENIVEALVAGRPPWRRTVNATDLGATMVIEVPDVGNVAVASPRWTTWKTAAVVAGSVGIAGLVTGVVLGVSAKGTHDEALRYCQSDGCTATGHELWEDANRKANLATFAAGAGLIALAGGAVLWFAAPSESHSPVEAASLTLESTTGFKVTVGGKL